VLNNGITYAANANGSVVTVTTPTGTATVASQGTIKATVYNTTNVNAGAKYNFGSVLVSLGYQQIKFEDPAAGDAAYFSGLAAGSQYAYGQQIASYTVTAIGPNDKKQTLTSLTAAWDVTSKFKLSGGIYSVKIDDYSVNAPTSAKGSSTNRYVSLIADYAVTKAFDIYAGEMNVAASGNAVNSVLVPSACHTMRPSASTCLITPCVEPRKVCTRSPTCNSVLAHNSSMIPTIASRSSTPAM